MIRHSLHWFAAFAILVGSSWNTLRAAETTDQILDRFVGELDGRKNLPEEARKQIVALVKVLRADPEGKALAVTESLRAISPEYQQALTDLGDENLGVALPALAKLAGSDDPWLAADAAYYLARGYLIGERFEDAMPLLEQLRTKLADRSVHQGEALFLQGVAQIQLLKHKDALDSLAKFIKEYPEAPERMRVAAVRQMEQLKLVEEGTLSDVQLRMDYSRRKLGLEDTGKDTREQQDKIISMLAKLIKEAEDKEAQGKGSSKKPGEKKPGQGQGSEGEGEGQGAGQSQGGNSGGGSKGTDTEAVKRLHRGGPQSPWSHLRDKERDPVYSAIKEKFPGRYQQLIEQYYKSFQDETDGG
jgi:tetratricopeptide (TPR) repeat protein